jgi:predicted  nucleic acid-binding Zn-ribbon protein
VLLSEARVQQEAYNSGLAERGAKLTEQQKVQARYNLILRDTKLQQGDFARTSEGLANQQRILAAEFENLQTVIGSLLLPTIVDLTSDLTALLSVASKIPNAFGAMGRISSGLPGPLGNIGKVYKDSLIESAPVIGPALKGKRIIGDLLGGGDDDKSTKLEDIQKKAAEAQKKLIDLAVEGKRGTDEYRKAKRELSAADDELAAAEKKAETALADLGGETDKQAEREKKLKEKIEARIGATIASFDSNLAAERGWITLGESIEAAGEEEDANKRNLELTGAALDQAGLLASAAADNYEKLTGKTATAEQQQQFLRDALNSVAQRFPELAPLISGYIAELDAIPPSKNTTITADTSDAKQKISELLRLIREAVDSTVPGGGIIDPSLLPKGKKKAMGGPVKANTPYIVGERGPELFVPSTAGSIVPNHAITSTGANPSGTTTVRNYAVTVQVAPTANLADVGRATVEAIRAFERGSGNAWRSN